MSTEYRKRLGRFEISFTGSWGSIWQYHANGSGNIQAEIIQLNFDSLKDLQYLISRALEEVSERPSVQGTSRG